jgi:hypothetical protein
MRPFKCQKIGMLDRVIQSSYSPILSVLAAMVALQSAFVQDRWLRFFANKLKLPPNDESVEAGIGLQGSAGRTADSGGAARWGGFNPEAKVK